MKARPAVCVYVARASFLSFVEAVHTAEQLPALLASTAAGLWWARRRIEAGAAVDLSDGVSYVCVDLGGAVELARLLDLAELVASGPALSQIRRAGVSLRTWAGLTDGQGILFAGGGGGPGKN